MIEENTPAGGDLSGGSRSPQHRTVSSTRSPQASALPTSSADETVGRWRSQTIAAYIAAPTLDCAVDA